MYNNYNAPAGSRAIILTRVSTEGQNDNTSHETQYQHAMSLIQSEGWQFVKRYQETESGALYEQRTETQAAIEDLEADRADVLVLYDSTRYGRDVEYQFKMLRRILRAGKWLQFATFRLEYDENHELTVESEAMFTNLAGTSSTERRSILRRFARGRARRMEQGYTPWATKSPYGYYIVQKRDVIRGEYPESMRGRYVVDESKREIVKAIFEKIDAGKSKNALCRWLYEQQIPSPTGVSYWRPSTLASILKNPVYKGQPHLRRKKYMRDDERLRRGMNPIHAVQRPEREHVVLECPPIVTAELWARCQERLAAACETRSGRSSNRRILSGLVRCPECRRCCVSAGNSTSPSLYYHCNRNVSNLDQSTRCTRRVMYPMAALDEIVIRAVVHIAERPEIVEQALAEYRNAHRGFAPADQCGDSEALRAKIAQVKAREIRAAEMEIDALESGRNADTYTELVFKYAAERRALEALQSKAQAPRVRAMPPDVCPAEKAALLPRQVLCDPEISAAEKNELLHSVIRVIYPACVPRERHTKHSGENRIEQAVIRMYSPYPGYEYECIVTQDKIMTRLIAVQPAN